MKKYLYNDLWFCLFNPIAGKGDHNKIRKEIEYLFEENNIEFELITTKYKGDAIKIVQEKILQGYINFVAIGGDGTVHEVVNGIMNQDFIDTREINMAVIPVGTGYDWAKHHNIPNNIEQAFFLILNGNTSLQDVGVVDFMDLAGKNKREYFNNVAGMAYDAYVVKKLEERKSKPNKFIYIFSVLSYLFKYKMQSAKIKLDNLTFVNRFYTINAGICKYSGGGMSLVPHAKHDDGQLAITLAGEISKLDVILNIWRFYNESLLRHPKIDGFFSKTIDVESLSEHPVLLELDGELVGMTPVKINIVPKSLRFISRKQ